MKVLATAGHVDHGKSSLVQALTGINPDRLQEEQERQMTIDLGFAWMTLPYGEQVGIIDVPGHRDFIENMLAGVGGIDAALLVVAADEGVMPQTREHLAILDLLEVERGVVALTKIDLVEDEWQELVCDEIEQLLKETHLADVPIVAVSATTGEGLDSLVTAMSETLQDAPPRRDFGRPRLFIDRVFTISGFGTVVTGTLVDGSLRVGQEVEILPGRIKGRIRGLQTHKTKIEEAVPGSRVAANLAGVEVRDLSRGDVVTNPGTYQPTRLIDVRLKLLSDAVSVIKHDQQVKLFHGTAQRLARVRLLGMETMRPGDQRWLQLVVDKPLVVSRGDRFILRRPSPGATLGGGRVVDAHPARRHRRKDPEQMERLERLLQGTPSQVLAQSLMSLGPTSLRRAIRHSGLAPDAALQAIEELRATGELIALEDGPLDLSSKVLVIDGRTWEGLRDRIEWELQSFHQLNPLRAGMPREELKSRLRLDGKVYSAVIRLAAEKGVVVVDGTWVRSIHHAITLTTSQQQNVDSLLERFHASPLNPPSVKECNQAVGVNLMAYLLESGRLTQVSPDVVFTIGVYNEMVEAVCHALNEGGTITVAKARDLLNTSRKYALALMEHLDAIGITVRDGDLRRLVRK